MSKNHIKFLDLDEYVPDLSDESFLKTLVHESNNFLSPISGFTEILLMEDSLDPKHQSYLDEITTAVQRHVEFNQLLLMLSGKLEPRKEDVSSDEFADLFSSNKFELNNSLSDAVCFTTNRTWMIKIVDALMVFADSLQQNSTPILFANENDLFKMTAKFSTQPNVINPARFFQPFYTSRKLSSEKGLGLCWIPALMKNLGGKIQLEMSALGDLEMSLYFTNMD